MPRTSRGACFCHFINSGSSSSILFHPFPISFPSLNSSPIALPCNLPHLYLPASEEEAKVHSHERKRQLGCKTATMGPLFFCSAILECRDETAACRRGSGQGPCFPFCLLAVDALERQCPPHDRGDVPFPPTKLGLSTTSFACPLQP